MARILIVDDDGLTRMLLRRILERASYVVDEAKNGIEGVAMFRAAKYDLAIVDIYMPKQDGLETIDQMDPASSGVPVIAMSACTGDMGTDPLQLALTLGASKVFTKDFKDEDLLHAIWELTHHRAVKA
ncbi:MAG: response regulator [Planctomycetes bacterium]|nr:response regulator [Planctomycetota bacterium]